jgi:hypothetical protein
LAASDAHVEHLLDAQLAPELAALCAVLGNTGTLAVELVVLGSGELPGALRAVVAAAGAGRSAGKRHARRLAGEDSLGEHGGRGGVEIGAIAGVGRKGGGAMIALRLWCELSCSSFRTALARLSRLRFPLPAAM